MNPQKLAEQVRQQDYTYFQQFDGLVFDCDGTLADTMPVHFVAWNEILQANGIEFSEDRFYAMAGQPTVKIVQILLDEHGIAGDAAAIAKEKELAFLKNLSQVAPIQPVVDIARAFHGQKRMGVGSGSNRQVVLDLLQHMDIHHLFSGIVGAEDTERHKPEPDVFLEVARRIGASPEKCIVFEDADLGIESAQRAGMACFDVRHVHQPKRVTSG